MSRAAPRSFERQSRARRTAARPCPAGPRRGGLVGLGLAAAISATPTPADACTSASGVEFVYVPGAHRPVAPGDPIAVGMVTFAVSPADALPMITASLERDGVVTGATVEGIDLAPPPVPGIDRVRSVLLLVRPDASLEANSAYTLELDYTGAGSGDGSRSVTITTGEGPGPAPSLTPGGAIETGAREPLARACCETGHSSCGDHYYCSTTEVRFGPSARIEATIAVTDQAYSLPWIAERGDGGALVGRRYPGFEGRAGLPVTDESELWTAVAFDFALLSDEGERCFVAGVTDLRDGSEATAEPFCVDTSGALPAPEVETYEPSNPSSFLPCLGPWIPEDPADEAAGGCSLGSTSPLALVLLALARLRRRRS